MMILRTDFPEYFHGFPSAQTLKNHHLAHVESPWLSANPENAQYFSTIHVCCFNPQFCCWKIIMFLGYIIIAGSISICVSQISISAEITIF